MSEPKLLSTDSGAVRILTLNRPAKRNAVDTGMAQLLVDALRAADADDTVGAVLLTATGPAFSAGADMAEFDGLPSPDVPYARRSDLFEVLLNLPASLGKPVLCAAAGPVIGTGAGLALSADMVIASEDALLSYPEVKRAMVPSLMVGNLVRNCGRKAAFELVVAGAPMPARRALELGIFNAVVPREALMETAMRTAQGLAAMDRETMALTKRLFHEVIDLPVPQALAAGRAFARRRAARG